MFICDEVRQSETNWDLHFVQFDSGWHRLVFTAGVGAGEMFNTEQLAALNIDIDTSILPVV